MRKKGFSGFNGQCSSKGRSLDAILEELQGVLSPFFFPLGGFILGIAEALTAGYISSALKDIVAFVIMILVLIVKPEGVFSKYSVEKV